MHLSKTKILLMQEAHYHSLIEDVFDSLFLDLIKSREQNHILSEADIHRLLFATEFAAERHHEQTRRDLERTPYIIHPLRVARHLLSIGRIHDSDVLMAGLLHDTVEDTVTTLKELRNLFGYRVENLVYELTDDKNLPRYERKQLQVQQAQDRSVQAAWIILADKLSNLSDLMENPPVGWDEERISNYFLWAQEVIKNLPQVNPFLMNAVQEIIDAYWENRVHQEYGDWNLCNH